MSGVEFPLDIPLQASLHDHARGSKAWLHYCHFLHAWLFQDTAENPRGISHAY
jgi:hypothetical protein